MGVTYLLDTHVVIWLVGRRPKSAPAPSRRTRDIIEDSETDAVVSAVSAFEVATKVRLGRLDEARALAETWSTSVRTLGARPLQVTDAHAVRGGRLEWQHRDPFDRLLVAQALVDGLVLLTADPVVQDAPGVQVQKW
ncbi:MAG: type II toxin-antitoxin system VapC family toxin [Mycobacterium sp.]|nr:type II toxin-antitoxin system VapC family toxin [Mycobacterium sp.]